MSTPCIRPGDDVLVAFYTSSDPDTPLLEIKLPVDQALSVLGKLMGTLAVYRAAAAEQSPTEPKEKNPRLVVVR